MLVLDISWVLFPVIVHVADQFFLIEVKKLREESYVFISKPFLSHEGNAEVCIRLTRNPTPEINDNVNNDCAAYRGRESEIPGMLQAIYVAWLNTS
ncbi:hypothetical protein DFH11DRAFT_1740325 [Phellopilus nigrolimitatus]|nr:hypothetical protein DFH11DRAFT_1740325 [Phellopilus nigrolimitatus]